MRRGRVAALIFLTLVSVPGLFALPPQSPEVAARRGKLARGTGAEAPAIRLSEPRSGWTSQYQIKIAGSCSDATADPVEVNINGTRYYIRSHTGSFGRNFPAAPGNNQISVECRNSHGAARANITSALFRKKAVSAGELSGIQ